MEATVDKDALWAELERLGNFEQDTKDLKDMKRGGEQLIARVVERAGLRIALAVVAPERFIPHG